MRKLGAYLSGSAGASPAAARPLVLGGARRADQRHASGFFPSTEGRSGTPARHRSPLATGLAEERLLATEGAHPPAVERCPLSALPSRALSPSGKTRPRSAALRSQGACACTARFPPNAWRQFCDGAIWLAENVLWWLTAVTVSGDCRCDRVGPSAHHPVRFTFVN